MSESDIRIVTLAERPDLVPVVAAWLWDAFDRADGHTPDQSRDMVAAAARERGMPQSFVLLEEAQPVATAALLAADAPERPDITSWLGGVFVKPEARGRGFATRLVRRVEQAAREEGVETLWLYTHSAEQLYAGLGWRRTEAFIRGGRPAALMRRDLKTTDGLRSTACS